MEEVPYRLVQVKFEPKTWEIIEAHVERNTFVPVHRKAAWREAIAFVKQEMGKGFLDTTNIWHPVNYLLGVGGAGQVEAFIRWVNVLKELKANAEGYERLRKLLRSKKQSRPEGMPFMDIACRYTASGFDIAFLTEKQNEKTPDIELTYTPTQEKLYVEVSRLENTAARDQQGNQYDAFLNVIWYYAYDLPVAGGMKRYIDADKLEAVLQTVRELKDKCWSTQSMVFIDNNDLAIAFSTNGSFTDLERWCADTGYTKGFNGPPANFHDIPRLTTHSRIRNKAKQIPVTETGLLYFPLQTMFMLVTNPVDFIEQIIPAICELPHILGVVLYADSGGFSLKPFCHYDYLEFVYAVQQDEAGMIRETIYICNPGYTGSISEEVKLQIRKAVSFSFAI